MFYKSDYIRVEQSIEKALNVSTPSPDVINNTTTSLLDVKKTAVVAATAALITAQAIQNQLSTSSSPIDGNNTSTWTNPSAQQMMFLPT